MVLSRPSPQQELINPMEQPQGPSAYGESPSMSSLLGDNNRF
jgi:hypothetical protein